MLCFCTNEHQLRMCLLFDHRKLGLLMQRTGREERRGGEEDRKGGEEEDRKRGAGGETRPSIFLLQSVALTSKQRLAVHINHRAQ